MVKLIIGIVALLAVTMATPAYAHDGRDHSGAADGRRDEVTSRTTETVEKTREAAKPVHNELKEKHSEVKEHKVGLKEQINERRTALKHDIDIARTERKSELQDKRLSLCQQRQKSINGLMTDSAKAARKQLAHIQNIEANLKEFYSRQQLESSEYSVALVLVDEKEAIAVAAVEVSESQQFNCSKVDGDNPSGEIRALSTARHDALTDYRGNVKQLVQIVKSASKAKLTEGHTS